MAKKKILLIQFRINNITAQHEKECMMKALDKKRVILISKNIFKNDLNFLKKSISNIDAIIIGGSGDFNISGKEKDKKLWLRIKRIDSFIKKAIKKNIPILGICFGHQYLANLLGSKIIGNRDQKEIGAFKIHLTAVGRADSLFKGIPNTFLCKKVMEIVLKSYQKEPIF